MYLTAIQVNSIKLWHFELFPAEHLPPWHAAWVMYVLKVTKLYSQHRSPSDVCISHMRVSTRLWIWTLHYAHTNTGWREVFEEAKIGFIAEYCFCLRKLLRIAKKDRETHGAHSYALPHWYWCETKVMNRGNSWVVHDTAWLCSHLHGCLLVFAAASASFVFVYNGNFVAVPEVRNVTFSVMHRLPYYIARQLNWLVHI